MVNSGVLPAAIPSPGDDGLTEASGRHLYVLLDFHNRCNLRCRMCYLTRMAAEPPVEIDRALYDRFAAAVFPVCYQVNFSCAYEPLLFRGLFDCLAAGLAHDVPVLSLSTNGMLLDRAKAEHLVRMGFPRLAVSVDAATPATYATIRAGGSYATLLGNLRGLVAAKAEARSLLPQLQCSFVLLEENLDEIEACIERMAEFSPHRFVFMHRDWATPPPERRGAVTAALRRALAACVRHRVLFEEVPACCLSPQEIGDAYGVALPPLPGPARCRDPWHFLRLTPTGEVFRCVNTQVAAGNIRQEDIAAVWNGEDYVRLREKLAGDEPYGHCRACGLFTGGNVRYRRWREQVDRLLAAALQPATGNGTRVDRVQCRQGADGC